VLAFEGITEMERLIFPTRLKVDIDQVGTQDSSLVAGWPRQRVC